MSDEQDQDVREFRLEGMTLVVAGGLLMAVVAGSFFAGRWYERRQAPQMAVLGGSAGTVDPLGNVEVGDSGDVGADMTFFDTLDGEEKELEPQRQVQKPKPKPQEVQTAAAERKPAEASPKPAEPAAKPASDNGNAEATIEAQASPAPASTVSESGPFFVQVIAGRDRESIERVVRKLKDGGYPVRLDSESDGGQRLFKVRVGGYSSRDDALTAADKLKADGYSGAFIKQLG